MGEKHNIQGIIMQPFYPNCLFKGEFVCQQNGSLDGALIDRWGESKIVGMLDESKGEMDFRKKYSSREDIVFYSFKKQGSLWVGSYTGTATGPGGAQCEVYDVMPDIDWDLRALQETINPAIVEESGKYLLKSMIERGYLEVVGKDETGDDIIRFTNKGKSFPNPDRN